jgi:hypothetical protein
MAEEKKRIASIEMAGDGPTELSFAKLKNWVIWQFPGGKQEWLSGAVHPPTPKHGWIPATIHLKKKRLNVFAHCTKTFSTPEAAAEWLEKQ